MSSAKSRKVRGGRRKTARQTRPKRVLTARKTVELADVDRLVSDKLAQRDKAALAKIPAPAAQTWKLSPEEVVLVKNHIAKGATDKELEFCLAVARRRKLDPFKQQIWFVKRNDRTAEGGARWIPMVGIDGLCHLAARDHRDYGSNDEPEFGPMHKVPWSYDRQSGTIDAPEWAKVAVWKKGASRPTVATVFWAEIYPKIDTAPLVREKPRLMLGKCALAQAIRRAYPDTGGLYIPEEFAGQEEQQFTESGRKVEVLAPKSELDCTFCGKLDAPNGCAEEKCPIRKDPNYLKLTPEQKKVVDRTIAGHASSQSSTQASTAKPAGAGAVNSGQPAAPPKPAPTPPPPKGATIYYVWHQDTQTTTIDPPNFPLMADMKTIFKKLLKGPEGQKRVMPTNDELDALQYECQRRGIKLVRRFPGREPGE
jgi:RecT family